eukprot:9132546-Alexandrium_andersonii.AAC.1
MGRTSSACALTVPMMERQARTARSATRAAVTARYSRMGGAFRTAPQAHAMETAGPDRIGRDAEEAREGH